MLFCAHPGNVLLGMLGDESEAVRRIAVNKIHSIKGNLTHFEIGNGGLLAVSCYR